MAGLGFGIERFFERVLYKRFVLAGKSEGAMAGKSEGGRWREREWNSRGSGTHPVSLRHRSLFPEVVLLGFFETKGKCII